MINRRLVIIILIGVFVVVPLVLFGLYEAFWKGSSSGNQNPVVVTDRDTGEQVTFDPNKAPDTDGTPGISILGISQFYDDNLIPSQIKFFQDQVGAYSKNSLKSKYSTITVVPEFYVNDGKGTITGKLRLGQGDDLVPFTFTAKNTGETQLIIQDSANKYGGNFDSGLTTFAGE